MKKDKKNLNGHEDELHINEGVQALVNDGYFDDVIKLQKFVNSLIDGSFKKVKKKVK